VSAPSNGGGAANTPPATVVIHGKRLPAPTEGDPIPSGQVVWISRPDNSIRQEWTSPTEWHFEFARASERPRFERVERRTRELFDGELQIASFHPHYQFADSDADAVENCTNRSPHPILHLLREASIERAVGAIDDPDTIYQRNMETLRRLGSGGWQALWDDG